MERTHLEEPPQADGGAPSCRSFAAPSGPSRHRCCTPSAHRLAPMRGSLRPLGLPVSRRCERNAAPCRRLVPRRTGRGRLAQRQRRGARHPRPRMTPRDPRIAGLFAPGAGARRAPRLGRAGSRSPLGHGPAVPCALRGSGSSPLIAAMFFGMSAKPRHRTLALGRRRECGPAAAIFPACPLASSHAAGRPAARPAVPGRRWRHAGPPPTYALVASAQLLALFALWTPSGIVWWRADGWAFWAICSAYGRVMDLACEGELSTPAPRSSPAPSAGCRCLPRRRPLFPDMPTLGLFRVIRQPIYVAFAADALDGARLDARPARARDGLTRPTACSPRA